MQPVPESIADAIGRFDLPSMPQVLSRLLDLSDSESVSSAELADVVRLDPALSVHVLVAANHSFRALDGQLKTIDRCVGTLGPRLVRTMMACLAIRGV